jgi:site-specific DNA-methyltransferase (adenine-specific)
MPVSEVFNMDCVEGMKQYPDKFFDLAIVDPPYGINADGAQNKAAESRIKANGKSKAGRGWKLYKETKWDLGIPTDDYFSELFRVSKNQIVWGGNYMTEYLPPSMGWIVWDKGQRDFSLADGELAWCSFDRALRIFTYSRGAALAADERIHPTQKPVKLYRWLLQNYAKEGDKILDTHLGSGSSRIAAYDMGFDFTAFELDKDYFEAQEKRFKEQTAQLKLIA